MLVSKIRTYAPLPWPASDTTEPKVKNRRSSGRAVMRFGLAQMIEESLLPPIAFGLLQKRWIDHLSQRAAFGQGNRVILIVEGDVENAQRAREVAQDKPGEQRFVVNERIYRAGLQRLQPFYWSIKAAMRNSLMVEIVRRRGIRGSTDADG